MSAQLPADVRDDDTLKSWAAPRPSGLVSSALCIAYLFAAVPLTSSWFSSGWPFELASHFIVCAAWAFALLAACAFGLRRRRLALCGALIVMLHGALLAPLYVPAQAGPRTSSRLRVVSANLLYVNHDPAPMRAWLAQVDPDLVVLLELTPEWVRGLSSELGHYASRIELPREDSFGIAVYSKRMPLHDLLLRHKPPVIAARVGTEAGAFTLFAVHTIPPVSAPASHRRDAELSAIATAANAAGSRVVIAGDLNATSWSPVFRHAFGSGAWADSRAGFGIQGSWPASLPAPLRIPIDHILVGPGFRVLQRELGPDVGSDHRPVLAEIGLSK